MIGRTLSHYQISEKLGEGGMGVVYLARDAQLGRLVAIKLLAEASPDPARRMQFLQEARMASALNHPNIVTIHEIANDSGVEFIVMELVKGATLEERLAGKALPVPAALRCAVQIADALAAAHAAGLVHRDLKPRNIMVSDDGLVKVLDFGLAQPAHDPSGDSDAATRTVLFGDVPATGAGTIVGTIEYMSPEQAEGKSLDARSDIFSFGTILYEMLAGERPFRGSSPIAILSAVLRDEPRPLHELAPGVPQELERMIARCLRKNAVERTFSAAELKTALEQLVPIASSTSGRHTVYAAAETTPSIAVLPFANLSSDKENEYFSDGLAEEILNALSRIDGLRVTARTSAFAFRGKHEDVRAIGEALNVRTILEGSVRRSGDRVRVSAQLVDAAAGYQLWADRFDREMTDIFAIQDEIAQAIVERLRLELVAPPRPAPLRQENLEAYNLCLKGRYHLMKLTDEGIARAMRCFEQAIAIDPKYAIAHSSIAAVYWLSGYFGAAAPARVMPLAKAAAVRALELDAGIGSGHAVLGCLLACYDYAWKEAEQEFDRALELDPAAVDARTLRAFQLLRPLGRIPEAIREFEKALQLDPLSPSFHNQLAYLVYLEREYDRSLEICRASTDIDPTYYLAHLTAAACRMRQGRFDEALESVRKAVALNPTSPLVLSSLGEVHALTGRHDAARQVLAQLESLADRRYIPPSARAGILNALGEVDAAFTAWMESVEARDSFVLPVKTVPSMDPVRSDPRYFELLRRLNLEPA